MHSYSKVASMHKKALAAVIFSILLCTHRDVQAGVVQYSIGLVRRGITAVVDKAQRNPGDTAFFCLFACAAAYLVYDMFTVKDHAPLVHHPHHVHHDHWFNNKPRYDDYYEAPPVLNTATQTTDVSNTLPTTQSSSTTPSQVHESDLDTILSTLI